MYVDWTKHLTDPKAKTAFEDQVKSCKPVLDHLVKLIENKELTLDRSEMELSTYDKPNWAERQAHKNGYRAGLSYLKLLVNLDNQG